MSKNIHTTSSVLNTAFIQESATTTTSNTAASSNSAASSSSAASTNTYDYCRCYGSFIAEIDEPEIDLCMIATVRAHGDIKHLSLDDHCECPACLGHINECFECGGIYLVSGTMDDYEREAEDDMIPDSESLSDWDERYNHHRYDKTPEKEAIDPKIEAIMKATREWSIKTMDEDEPTIGRMPKSASKPMSMAQAIIISNCFSHKR